MNSESTPASTDPAPVPAADPPQAAAAASGDAASALRLSRRLLLVFAALTVLALISTVLLWQKLSNIQEQLARQSADAGSQAVEARTVARQAQELARETAARQAVTDTRLSEVSLQRSQLEELMQSLSRSRVENLVVDIESAIRLAQQQAQLTGSVEPLLAALRTADQRLARAAQPRLTRLRAAVARDIDRIKGAGTVDLPGLLVRLDELVRQIDELPVANAVAPVAGASRPMAGASAAAQPSWQRGLETLRDKAVAELRALVRVSRIEDPDAVLLSPEQSFFLRENLKLKLLNARLALLARQTDSAREDLNASAVALSKYFDPGSRRTQVAIASLQQVQSRMKNIELPRVEETLAALATAAAGR
ncbi:MAG: uroporphyrinogen-III C-methyltransferase [Burkholderiaceae bacterium]|nr:uroporphyrinogen-III C-methyltransferase [Burkholderiaceae bacterium]